MGVTRRFLATSDDPLSRTARRAVRALRELSVPAPRVLVVPALHGVLAARQLYYFSMRVLVAEPLFKAYCKEYGDNLHTDIYLHWVQGKGDIYIGDNVLLDGKISLSFAARFSERPVLRIGSHTGINHGVSITVAKRVTIGEHCRIAPGVTIFDSPGHPTDPVARKAGKPPRDEDVRPVAIGDNVWIGRGATICPGVTIGEGSIVSLGAVVMSDVPPYSIVAGNPARKIGAMPSASATQVKPAHAEGSE
jgi:acetyltransferase-like isoleucine patch superfamily enzyme